LRGIHGLIPSRDVRPSEREPLTILLRRLQAQQSAGKIQCWSFTFPHAASETAEKP